LIRKKNGSSEAA